MVISRDELLPIVFDRWVYNYAWASGSNHRVVDMAYGMASDAVLNLRVVICSWRIASRTLVAILIH